VGWGASARAHQPPVFCFEYRKRQPIAFSGHVKHRWRKLIPRASRLHHSGARDEFPIINLILFPFRWVICRGSV
jgi:hypothetical protein